MVPLERIDGVRERNRVSPNGGCQCIGVSKEFIDTELLGSWQISFFKLDVLTTLVTNSLHALTLR